MRRPAIHLIQRYIEQELMIPEATLVDLPGRVRHAVGMSSGTLDELRKQVSGCTQCRLAEGRTTLVFGHGNPEAALMVIGEAPGMEEDKQGLPFVGPSGQLLTKMLAAIELSRECVYITNVVKCRPPQNRNPAADEIFSCRRILEEQICRIRPRAILALGAVAARTLLDSEVASIGRLRGRTYRYADTPVVVSYHPAYLLRKPSVKKDSWEDLKMLKKLLLDSQENSRD